MVVGGRQRSSKVVNWSSKVVKGRQRSSIGRQRSSKVVKGRQKSSKVVKLAGGHMATTVLFLFGND